MKIYNVPKCTTFVILMLLSGLVNASIVQIGLSDFNNSTVIDFEGIPIGSISGSDALFTNAGISSVIATPEGTNSDTYGTRANSSRALGANSSGLFIADPGAIGAADTNDWLINLESPQFRFGIGMHDQSFGNIFPQITLFFDGTEVDTLSVAAPNGDLFQIYFESTLAFNSLTISQPGIDSGFGFMLDNLTIETTVVPITPAIWLYFSGLIALIRIRKK